MQTILGSGGAIGNDLARELVKYTDKIRLVSRNPEKINESDELLQADLNVDFQVEEAVRGSEVVYLTAGFEYKTKTWQDTWPRVMKNVIDACKKHEARLVFFDNMYMYDRDHLDQMSEDTPIRPTSKKGVVRKHIAEMLMEEVSKGNLQALIARAADFYGPKNSILVEMVYKNLRAGKKAMWVASVDKVHNFTFTPDAARGTAMLGNKEDAFGQVWHLPTDPTRLTLRDWINLIAKELDAKPGFNVIPIWMLGALGMVNPVMKEFKEMSYQYNRDYLFASGKFEKEFNFKATTPEQGIRMLKEMV